MPKRIPRVIEERAIQLYERERLSIQQVQTKLASEGMIVGTNWIRRKALEHGVLRTHSEAMEHAMKARRLPRTCVCCSSHFMGRQVNEKYCEICAPTPQAHRRLKLYGIRERDFLARLEEQKYKCVICAVPFDNIPIPKGRTTSIVVDHVHNVGRVRGLLCQECNVAVGYVEKHSHHMLDKILNYLGRAI